MRIFNLDLKSKIDRLKFIVLFSGFMLFLIVASGIGLKITSTPGFCVTCHSMTPEYATWQASSHSQIACNECHIEPGAINKITQKRSGLKHLYSQVSGNYYLPIRQKLPIKSEVCLKCHSLERDFSPGGDLIIPHTTHYDQQVGCVRCHSGVAHGNIASRRATVATSLSEWDSFKAKQEMTVDNTKTPMDDCMKCHQRREAPLECNACHKNSKEPLSHKKLDFKITHGKDALTKLDTCNLCHGYSGYVGGEAKEKYTGYKPTKKDKSGRLVSIKLLMPEKERSAKELVNYSRDNRFCLDCHSKRPDTHTKDFSDNHGLKAKSNSDVCFTCHSNRSEEKNPIKAVSCSNCHPSTHNKRDWRQTHPISVYGKIDQSCFSCHSSNNCTNCHTSMKSKTENKTQLDNTQNLTGMEGEFE